MAPGFIHNKEVKMKFTLMTTLILALNIAACGDSNEDAVGLYKYKAPMTGAEKIAQVKKDGDVYLFVEDVIRNSNARALTKNADGLSYNNMPLKISEDGQTLYFGRINGVRVDNHYLSERLNAIENNKKICAELQKEVTGNEKNMSKEQWNEYIKSLKSRTPTDCNIIGAGMRW